jgi:CRISPR-associated protein Csb2
VDWVLLAISGINGNRRLLPSVTRVLPQGELLHRALNFHASRLSGHSVVLSGCDEGGRPLKVSHRHSHLLHLDLDGDAHLDHVLIWAPMGLDAAAQAAVRATRRTFMKRSATPLRLAVAGCGAKADVSNLRSGLGPAVQAIFGGARLEARVWRSLTPFVPPRYLKRHGRNTLAGQITAELLVRGFTEPESITVLDPRDVDSASISSVGRGRHFVRRRRHGPQPPADCGFMVELRFAEEVRGPISLGYASHYGLGLFAAT